MELERDVLARDDHVSDLTVILADPSPKFDAARAVVQAIECIDAGPDYDTIDKLLGQILALRERVADTLRR